MLSTFCFIVAVVVVGYASYHLLDFVFEVFIAERIYSASMWVAESYLMDNGRGFFKDKNWEAINAERSVRIFLTGLFYIAVILPVLLVVPFRYKLWVFSGLAIKIGAIVGLLVNLVLTEIIEIFNAAKIGRLVAINEKGIGHFRGDYCEDFDVDLSAWEDPEERPPVDKRYLVLDILIHKAFAPLDIG
ncbi:hypothetical protein IKQ38_04830 [Candidatus Saccharibacteria bacterium]|nr:hypothetical protein [Candidatus Saccharibacteria bacterium]